MACPVDHTSLANKQESGSSGSVNGAERGFGNELVGAVGSESAHLLCNIL